MILRGRHAVLEALKAGKRAIRQISMLEHGHGGVVDEIRQLAAARAVKIAVVPRAILDTLCRDQPHQGVVAFAEPLPELGLSDIVAVLKASVDPAFVVVLDEVKDPQNAGAILRTAEAAGVHGVVVTAHRSAFAGEGVERASAGATEHVPFVRVINLRAALEELKEAGCWVVGADMEGAKPHTDADLVRPVAIVLGEEGKGLRELTKKTCDELVRIPMRGQIASLNVSAAAAILCFEVIRQRGLVK